MKVLNSICLPKAGMCLLLCACMVVAGCSYSQAQVTAAVQRVETGLKTAESLLPGASTMLADLQITEPAIAATLAPVVANAKPALDKVIAACDAYVANPGANAYQAILNAVDALTSQVDQGALALAGIKDPQSQQKAVAEIALFSTGLHVALGILQNYATAKQAQAVKSARSHVPFDQVRPFLNREYARQQLLDLGYEQPDRILTAAGL